MPPLEELLQRQQSALHLLYIAAYHWMLQKTIGKLRDKYTVANKALSTDFQQAAQLYETMYACEMSGKAESGLRNGIAQLKQCLEVARTIQGSG